MCWQFSVQHFTTVWKQRVSVSQVQHYETLRVRVFAVVQHYTTLRVFVLPECACIFCSAISPISLLPSEWVGESRPQNLEIRGDIIP